jgi:small conductance mechanosensitive channel
MKTFAKNARLGPLLMATLLVLATGLCWAAPASAQGPGAAAVKKAQAQKAKSADQAPKGKPISGNKDLSEASTEELEALAKTLEDETERKKFLANLKALIQARKAQKPKGKKPGLTDGLIARVVGAMSSSVEALGNRANAVLGVMRDAPDLMPWLESWVEEDAKRDRLIGLIWRFLVIVGLGMLAQYVFRKLTQAWRRRLEEDAGTAIPGRIVRFLARTLLLFANAFAYGAGAYGALLALPMGGRSGQVLLVGASSFFAAKLILAATRMVVAPGTPLLRPVPVSDETANYLYLWVRRLVRIFVYAFFFLWAAQIVGLPEPAYRSLLYLVGLVFVAFLVLFVLQNRTQVGAAIRGDGAAQGRYGGLRTRLGATWHIFTILYIVAVYAVWALEVSGGFEYLMEATVWTVLIVAVAKLLIIAAERGIDRLFAVGAELEVRYPGLQARVNRYVPVLKGILSWVVYIGATLAVLDVWGIDTLGWLASDAGTLFLRRAVTVAFILLIGVIVWEIVSFAIGRYLEGMDGVSGAARARTLLPLMRTTALIVISIIVVLSVLSEVGFNIGPLLAGAGVIGLAIGFGSQKLVQDVITGLFMLIEDTLAVGDVVRFDADHSGVVEGISIRSVVLRDLSGNVHTLPFSEVKTILNMTKGFSYYVFEVGVAYREDIDHVMDVLRDIGQEMKDDPDWGAMMDQPLEVLGLDKFGDSAIIIKARIKVVPPIRQWAVGREFNRRMKARFDAEGIEIPFPHQTIYFGVDQKGDAPPAHVAMVDAAGKDNSDKDAPKKPDAAPDAASRARPTARPRSSSANIEDGEGDG